MNIEQESLDDFVVGYGGADAASKPIIADGYANKAYKGVRVRAATANTIVIYVGPKGVSVSTGYPLPAGEELCIPIQNPSKINVVATPAANSQQTATLAGHINGDTFTLTLNGATTAPLTVPANAAAVQAALEALSTVGAGNCSVADTGGTSPYTVTFIGALAKVDVNLMTAAGNGVNEVQNVTITNAIANDKTVLTFGANSTNELAYNSTSAQIQTALSGLASIGAGNVSVTDGATGWDVEFVGAKAKTDVGAITGVAGKNEKQTITVAGGTAGDKMVLSYGGNNTGEINYNVSGTDLQTALNTIVALDGKTSVTGNGPYVVEFIDSLAGTDVASITGVCGKNEQQTITVTGAAAGDKMVLTLGASSTPDLDYDITGLNLQTALRALASIGAGNCNVTGDGPYLVEFISGKAKTDMAPITGVGGKNEKQTITLDVSVDGGTFTLTYVDQTTGDLDWNISTIDMATALKLLSNIGDSDVAVTGAPGAWVVEFTGALAKTDVVMLVGDGTNLTGTDVVKDVTIVETFKGNLATIGVVENVKGNLATVGVVETLKGNTATVTVTETQKGDAACSVTVAKVADITLGSKYSWIAV